MTFQPGDKVLVEGQGPYAVRSSNFSAYPLEVDGNTYTQDGRITRDSLPTLSMWYPDSTIEYPLGKVQTLDNGIQIYHPNEGQPFQLIPTTKALL